MSPIRKAVRPLIDAWTLRQLMSIATVAERRRLTAWAEDQLRQRPATGSYARGQRVMLRYLLVELGQAAS